MRRILGRGKAEKSVAWVLALAFLPVGLMAETMVTIELLGDHLSLPHDPKMGVEGVSADGSVVVGWSDGRTPSDPWGAFRWIDGTMTFLEDLPSEGDWGSTANAVSADGSVVVGAGAPNAIQEAFRWENGTISGLGDLPGGDFDSEAHAVSADGLVVVGTGTSESGKEAFRWQNGSMTGLGFLLESEWSRANGVSADGSVVVGMSLSTTVVEAFRWENGTMVSLGDLPGGDFGSMATAVSADGSVVVGMSISTDGEEAFRWENGTMIGLGTLPDAGGSHALGVSADGSVVVGVCFGGPNSISRNGGEAVAWFEHDGWKIISLNEFLVSEGINLNGFRLGPAKAISMDGTTIVGFAEDHAGQQAYRIRIVAPSVDPLIGGIEIGDFGGWFLSDWFGAYNTELAPWLFHAEHRFIYRDPSSTNASLYFYDDAIGAWWWTNETFYPFIYVFDPPPDNLDTDIGPEWVFYFEGTSYPRSFGVVTGDHAGSFLSFDY